MKEGKYKLEFGVGKYVLMPVYFVSLYVCVICDLSRVPFSIKVRKLGYFTRDCLIF